MVDEIRVHLKTILALVGVPLILGECHRDVDRSLGVAEENILFHHAHVEDFDMLGIGLPHLIGFPGGHILPKAGLFPFWYLMICHCFISFITDFC